MELRSHGGRHCNIAPGNAIAESYADVERIECDLANAKDIEASLASPFSSAKAPDILTNNVGISPKFHSNGERIHSWDMTLDQ